MNTDELRELAASAAFGQATPDEVTRLEAAAAGDPALARELEAYRATVATLEGGVARAVPAEDLLDRIMAELDLPAGEPAAEPRPAREAPRVPRAWQRWHERLVWPRVVFGAAAAAVAVVAGISLLGDDAPEPDAVAAISGTEEFPGVRGEAELFAGQADGTLVVRLSSVPPAPGGHHYEVWVLRPGAEAMESVGELSPSGGEAELEVGLPAAGRFAAVDVSVEPDDGDPEHSGVSLAGGTFD